MPIYNIVTKKWTWPVEEQSRYGLDEDGNDLIYMDDEENNFGREYEYEYSYESGDESGEEYEEEEEACDDTPTQHSERQAELKKEILSLLK